MKSLHLFRVTAALCVALMLGSASSWAKSWNYSKTGVAGEMPAWSVTPSAYENTMNLVGQIYVNGILRSNSESRVAAFINGECRGLVAPKQVRGAAYVPLTIYGTAHQEVNGRTVDLDKG